MARTAPRPLPHKLLTSLHLLERGWVLCQPGVTPVGSFPDKVAELFHRLESEAIEWALVGAEAVNLHIRDPRATADVGIVVRKKHLRRAKKILTELCTDVEDSEVHLRGALSPPPLALSVDVFKSQSHILFDEALDRSDKIEGVRTPALEALLALRYLSSVSPWRRREAKLQDLSDFIRVYKENRSTIDRALLIKLASKAHENAAREFPVFLDAVENDRPLTI